jgi:nucleotide-binding universal stress UspA family protein
MRRTGEEILEGGKARAENAGVRADTVLLEGMKTRLCDAVAEQARAWGAELIVIGTHGRRGVGRMLLGSDAEQIARTSITPVLLVRAPNLPPA